MRPAFGTRDWCGSLMLKPVKSHMHISILLSTLTLALFATGCGTKQKVLGKSPKDKPSTILAINAGEAPNNLMLEGKMVEKCPQAGCWFRMEDGTGLIKVDTKAAGFVITEVPLNATVKVAGKLAYANDEPVIQATGLAY